MFFGTSQSNVFVYKHNGQSYLQNQTIALTAQPRSIAITADHTFLSVGDVDKSVYIYKHDGTQFNHFQTITYSNAAHRMVSITNDHQLLTVTDRTFEDAVRYFFN